MKMFIIGFLCGITFLFAALTAVTFIMIRNWKDPGVKATSYEEDDYNEEE